MDATSLLWASAPRSFSVVYSILTDLIYDMRLLTSKGDLKIMADRSQLLVVEDAFP